MMLIINRGLRGKYKNILIILNEKKLLIDASFEEALGCALIEKKLRKVKKYVSARVADPFGV